MSRRAVAVLLGAVGLVLFLWPALTAPVVLWSDSEIDMEWARQGAGVVSPAPPPASVPHPAKPGWIAFLRAATVSASPDAAARRVVVAQSFLVWLSAAAAAILLARRTSFAHGVAFFVAAMMFLRLRDSASAVMSEALTAALLLPIVAILLEPPAAVRPAIALGIGAAFLFLVRPNAGAIAAVLALVAFGWRRRGLALAAFAAGFLALAAPVVILTAAPGGDPLRGLMPTLDWARADYGWIHAPGLPAPAAADVPRLRVWRALHGVFGTEYYDPSGSGAYAGLSNAARAVSPLLLLGTVALIAVPSRGRTLGRALGLALLGLLVAQSWFLGPLPRFALPMLPALILCAVAAGPPARPAAAPAVFAGLLLAAAWPRHVFDREWGRIEASDVRIVQEIPRGSLPARAPATLHVRVAPALLPSSAQLQILGPSAETLYDSRGDADRRRPYVAVPLPESLLEENQRGRISIQLVSSGAYGPFHYLLFPVIPRPWGAPARRLGGVLSPSTSVSSGSLDWWAHPGAD